MANVNIFEGGPRLVSQKIKRRLKRLLEASGYHSSCGISNSDLKEQAGTVFENPIKISVISPLYNTNKKYLRKMIESVCRQSYANWELCLADASDERHAYVREICQDFSIKDTRILYKRLNENGGISANTNEAVKLASGDYLSLIDHDDEYTKNALFEIVKAINEHNPDVLYSDEDRITIDGKRESPFYKPDFSPDLLYSQMYTCHIFVIKKELFLELNGLDSRFDGSQDYDFMLRLSEKTNNIYHIPKILYSWRQTETSMSMNPDSKPYAHMAGLNALDSHLKRKYGKQAFAEETKNLCVYSARFPLSEEKPLVSIIIPTKDYADLLSNCIQSILEKTAYQNYEILILDNLSMQPETFDFFEEIKKENPNVRIISADMEFNWSKLSNLGIQKAKGVVFVFLNNDTFVISENWLEILAENALREDIGAAGALLLYENETIQHAGVVVGMNGWADHVYKGSKPIHSSSPFVSPVINRNVLAVTGACMAISKKTIMQIGSFDENFIICGSDVEICLRAHKNGLYNIFCAGAQLYHLESKSRNSFIPGIDFVMSEKHYNEFRKSGDPFFNPNLDLSNTTPTRTTCRKER